MRVCFNDGSLLGFMQRKINEDFSDYFESNYLSPPLNEWSNAIIPPGFLRTNNPFL